MAVLPTLTLTLVLLGLTLVDARRNRQRSGDTSGTDPRPPQWARRMTKQPEVKGTLGEPLVLSCPAEGRPKPEVTWLRDGVPLQQEPGSRRLVLGEGEKVRLKNWNLKMVDVKLSQAGNYTCIVKNEHGQLRWTFRVIIMADASPEPPQLVESPVNKTVRVGGNARLTCRPHTDEAYRDMVTVQWLKHYSVNGSTKDERGYPYVSVLEEMVDKYVMPSDEVLVVENLSMEDVGWYTCMVDIEGYPHAATHASAYINVKPSMATSHTTVSPQSTTERRKRKKHRKKSRGRNRKPEVATEPPSTEESSTQEVELGTAEVEFKEPEVEFGGAEVEFEKPEVSSEKPELSKESQEVNEPKIGSSKDSKSKGSAIKVNIVTLLGVLLGQFTYKLFRLSYH